MSRARARLSIASIPSNGSGSSDDLAGVNAEDRGTIAFLDTQDVVEMVAGDRRMSISSTDDDGKTYWANKTTKITGDELDPQDNYIGHTCRKGLKPESPNQDAWFVLKVEGSFSMYAVFDGHGQQGHDVSNFVKENLPKLLLKDARFKTDKMSSMVVDMFKKTQSLVSAADDLKMLSAQDSGTTATVVIHNHTSNRLTVSHVGDSSAVLGRFKSREKKEMEAVQLTRDHKPNLKDEWARIEKSGGRVEFDGFSNYRVFKKKEKYPGLNMSRCFGDIQGHRECGLIAEPEVSEINVMAEDHVLLVCSDGVWEFLTPIEAVNLVTEHEPSNAMEAAASLAREAWDRWIVKENGEVVDDITVVLAFLNQPPQL